MPNRPLLVVALLAIACGGGDLTTSEGAPIAVAGVGGGAAGAPELAGSAGAPGGAGGALAGQAGAAPAASGGSGAGAPAGGAGAATAGGPAGGTTHQAGASVAGSAAGGSSAGTGGSSSGAGGGANVDPLEPKPVPGCPGYVSVLIPKGTCAWFHGTFTLQIAGCGISNPPEDKCATASAVSKDIETIVSTSALISRFDFDETGCPKTCN